VIQQCASDYYVASQWNIPNTCMCCDCSRHSAKIFIENITAELASDWHLQLLQVTDPFIQVQCVDSSDFKPFQFGMI
jgi:hypothetical protein